MIVAQVTGHFTDVFFKASTWELHSVTSRIVRRSIRQKRATLVCLQSQLGGVGGGDLRSYRVGFYAKSDFLK